MKFRNIIKEHKQKMKQDEEHICVLCKNKFKGKGNNASPIKEGLCCDDCNSEVILERINRIQEDKKNE